MSAEIIQFDQPERRSFLDSSPDAPRRRRRAIRQRVEKSRIRFMFDDQLHEAEFYGDDVQYVSAVQYRINTDGVKELRRRRWSKDRWTRGYDDALDPELERAAKLARKGGAVDATPSYQAAIAGLLQRRGNLAAKLEQVDAAIASLRGQIPA